MSRFPMFAAATALAAVACSRAAEPVTRHEPSAAAPTVIEADARAPIVASWREVARTPNSATVVARIERYGFLNVPVDVTIEVPPGVDVRGRRAFKIPAGTPAGAVEERYELSFAALPAADLVLTVDAAAEGFGFHAAVPYRFGRPEPKVPAPEATGGRVKAGPYDFGRSVPVGN